MTTPTKLICPVRGLLKVTGKSKDGLTATEESFRVDALKYLVAQGYPPGRILVEPVVRRLGAGGKNSLRADFAVLDVELSTVDTKNIDEVMDHAVILGEVKRDNAKADEAKSTQVEPLLDFATRTDALAVYWDNVEQRVFWSEVSKGKRSKKSGPISLLPGYGQSLSVKRLTWNDIAPTDSLIGVFRRIEDILHTKFDAEERYPIVLQLLITKIFDEQMHAAPSEHGKPMFIQDFVSLGVSGTAAKGEFEAALKSAAAMYNPYLKNPLSVTTKLTPQLLLEVCTLLAPIKVLGSQQSVMQEFYMYFAKTLYRWDQAQYFTPTIVTDFIVELANAQAGEAVKDPACGGADFLVAAFIRAKSKGYPNAAHSVFGSDNSNNAVQVAVLNMILHGDGRSNIVKEDSLVVSQKYKGNPHQVLICNPPFGSRITEKRQAVLKDYDLGHEWKKERGKGKRFKRTGVVRKSQELGMLFVEVCLRQCAPGGRVAIILPNGYLGNRSAKYVAFREWLLCNFRLVSVIGFPRFTFKKSGADVSASVVYLERRQTPLKAADADVGYSFSAAVVERVGWKLGDKQGEKMYLRDPADGSFVLDSNGKRIIDAEFDETIDDIRRSAVAGHFPWMVANTPQQQAKQTTGWSRPISDVVQETYLTMDPKRHCRKASELRAAIAAGPHLRLGDIVQVVPERQSSSGTWALTPSKTYEYISISDVSRGVGEGESLRGWQLPDRAKHEAQPGEIFVGSIWSSVEKWFVASTSQAGALVTNGMLRLRLKKGKEKHLPDIVAALSTQAYATQMRSLARGSDGLAEIAAADLREVLIPEVVDPVARQEVEAHAQRLLAGRMSLDATLDKLRSTGQYGAPEPPERAGHTSLV